MRGPGSAKARRATAVQKATRRLGLSRQRLRCWPPGAAACCAALTPRPPPPAASLRSAARPRGSDTPRSAGSARASQAATALPHCAGPPQRPSAPQRRRGRPTGEKSQAACVAWRRRRVKRKRGRPDPPDESSRQASAHALRSMWRTQRSRQRVCLCCSDAEMQREVVGPRAFMLRLAGAGGNVSSSRARKAAARSSTEQAPAGSCTGGAGPGAR